MLRPLNLAHKPTPIEVLDRILPNTKIHIKRDDLTGLEASGNKIRKLEYLLADALNKKCDVIITCGGIQSNHCRATMFCCAKLGLKGVVILKSKKQEVRSKNNTTYDGNLLLDYLFGAEIHLLSPKEYDKKEDYAHQLMDDFKKQGLNPYFIPTGGSNGIGALGYLYAMEEMASYIKLQGIDSIFCAVGSGGTYAGLLMGKYIFGLETPIYGILVDETIEYFITKVKNIIKESEQILERKFNISDSDIQLINSYIGPGYAIPYPEEIAIIKQVARKGIILDPVYTGKTFYGMLKEKEHIGFCNPLFIHTGGIFSLFAYKEYF
ncbi:MAG: D-cysteine desulfhydrase family protein [candidate division WOR-3 bacterium]|nr:D-cysteine desulfhydrase family protein [candidate division WOR-3 bacterium]